MLCKKVICSGLACFYFKIKMSITNCARVLKCNRIVNQTAVACVGESQISAKLTLGGYSGMVPSEPSGPRMPMGECPDPPPALGVAKTNW